MISSLFGKRGPLYLVFCGLSGLPLPFLQGLGALLGRLIYALDRRYRQRVQQHATQAGYVVPRFWRRAAAAAGAFTLECAYVWFRSPRAVARTVCPDEAILRAARASGRGIVYLTPHLGCFEVAAQYCARTVPLTVLFRPPRKAWLVPLLEQARGAAPGLTLAPANAAGVRTLLRALRRNGEVGMLPDQVPGQGEGLWAPFFGRDAYTMTLPLRLAQTTSALILLSYAERLPAGRGWRLRFEAWEPDWAQTLQHNVAEMNARLAALIQQCPEQYLWAYDRYKNPPA